MDSAAAKKRKKQKRGTSAGPLSRTDAMAKPQRSKERQEEARESNEKETILNSLIEAFSSYSLDKVKLAYQEADGDAARTAEMLLASSSDSTMRESSRGRSSMKQKKVVACTGLVSNVINKEDSGCFSGGRRERISEFARPKDTQNPMYSDAEAEEFLCSMLGGSCDLDPAVVKDVFGHSGYDVEKALDALLDLCDSTSNRSTKKMYGDHEERAQTERSIHDTLNGGNNNYKPLRGHLVTQSYPSGMKAAHEPSMGHDDRDNARSHESSEMQFLMEYSRGKLNLQQDVLESLFNVPIMSKQESGSMNWKKALKNVEYFAQGFEYNPTSSSIKRDEAEGYKGFRSAADQHREAMKSFYQQAAVAYAKGDRAHASYLSEKGNGFRKLAQTADEKASQAIFEARNKDIRNAVTIDLHGQHVKQAMKLVKVHLLLLAYVPSIKFLRVITGYGTHSIGKGRLKQSVTGLLRKEDIPWSEENPGTLVIEIDRSKKYSFMDVDSDDGTD